MEKRMSVVCDLETLGRGPGCAILEIGAVVVEKPWRIFHARITVESCLKRGLYMEAETVAWWFDMVCAQSVGGLVAAPKTCLDSALAGFAAWLKELGAGVRIWGNGAAFDLAILRVAYQACGMPLPWDFRAERDLRTALDVEITGGPAVARGKAVHRAVPDALAEAAALAQVMAAVEQREKGGAS